MRGQLSLLYVLGVLLVGLFGGATGDVLADERDERDVSGATAAVAFTPVLVDFGDVVVGETAFLSVTFTYTGTATIEFTHASGPIRDSPSDNGLNTLDARGCKGIKSTGNTCTVELSFTALAVGEVSGTLTFYNYFNGFTTSIALRGNGVSATALSVAAARGSYRCGVVLSATLVGCAGSVADRAVSLTLTTPTGHRTVAATTDADGVATATAVPLTIVTGGVAAAIPAGEYAPSAGWGIGASFAGGDGCAAGGGTAALTVERRVPALTFAAPAATTYGADPFALSVGSSAADDPAAPPLQLGYGPAGVCSGSATPPAMVTILGAGDCTMTLGQTAGDNANYAAAAPLAHTVAIARATPALAWATPGAIAYGTPLGSAQLRVTASFGGSPLSGSFGYTPDLGRELPVGSHTLAFTFTPADATNYTEVQMSVALTVTRATPVVTWATPAPIIYGTRLGAPQLGASATVAGEFAYSQTMGTVLGAGPHELTVLFTPIAVLPHQEILLVP